MLKDRLKVAIPLILVVLLAFFLPGIWGKCAFALLATAILLTSNHEGVVLAGLKPYSLQEVLIQLFGLVLLANAWANFTPDFLVLLCFVLLAFVSVFHQEVTQKSLETVARTILVGMLVPWCLSYMMRLFYELGEELGPMTLIYLVAITKFADIGAYAVGCSTAKLPGGNHKLALHVSPQKSWEGLFGGIAASVITSLLFWKFSDNMHSVLTLASAIILGVLAAVIGLIGDLSESLLKRAAGVKDSGKIPGLGGGLDVMDSLIPMGIVIYSWYYFMPNPIENLFH